MFTFWRSSFYTMIIIIITIIITVAHEFLD
jgi:hypothetical protein